jgi:hypothetical protein
MYSMSGPEMITQLKVKDTLRDAERLHRVSAALRERKAARHALFTLNVARFWHRRSDARPALQPPAS